MIFSGLYTALITPFDSSGKLDIEGLKKNIQLQIEAKVDGLVLLGSTGEASVLDESEKLEILTIARQQTKEMCLIAGASHPSTQQTIEMIKKFTDLGVNAFLTTTPYYNKPTQEGIFLHFEALSKETTLPIIIYNNKSRTAINIDTPTLKRIASLPNINGVKESSGDILQIADVIHQIRLERSDFSVFSGDDPLTYSIMALGGDGAISSISNIFPKKMKELVHFALKGDLQLAKSLHYELLPLFQAAFWETNPIAIKAIMQYCSLPCGIPRLPLTPLAAQFQEPLKNLLDKMRIIP